MNETKLDPPTEANGTSEPTNPIPTLSEVSSAAARKFWEGKTPEERKEIMRTRFAGAAWKAKSKASASKFWAGKSKEERVRIVRERMEKVRARGQTWGRPKKISGRGCAGRMLKEKTSEEGMKQQEIVAENNYWEAQAESWCDRWLNIFDLLIEELRVVLDAKRNAMTPAQFNPVTCFPTLRLVQHIITEELECCVNSMRMAKYIGVGIPSKLPPELGS